MTHFHAVHPGQAKQCMTFTHSKYTLSATPSHCLSRTDTPYMTLAHSKYTYPCTPACHPSRMDSQLLGVCANALCLPLLWCQLLHTVSILEGQLSMYISIMLIKCQFISLHLHCMYSPNDHPFFTPNDPEIALSC